MVWHPAKLALGAVIAAGFATYYAALETSCAKMSESDDGGELVITHGGTAVGTQPGTRLLAPRFAYSPEIPLNGTVEARLLWIEDLCDAVLDCSSCPPRVSSAFNASVLDGALLIFDKWSDMRLTMCGENRMARSLGRTGLVGIADGSLVQPPGVPGREPWRYRLGEYRDSLPHDGDEGIPFLYVDTLQYALIPILEALDNGAQMRAVVKPTAQNPWHSTLCGYWKPLQTSIMLGHAGVAERAASCLIGHVKSAGPRFDLAQGASMAEIMAHTSALLMLHDPFMSFHWGLLPFGTWPAINIFPVILMCGSTLLLAAFWYVRHGVRQVRPHNRPAYILRDASQVPNDRSRRACICSVRDQISTYSPRNRCFDQRPSSIFFVHRGTESIMFRCAAQ